MSAQLSQREKTLAMFVGAVVVLLVNVVLINIFIKNHKRLRDERTTKTSQLETMQALFADKEMWAQREAWLKAKQPKLEDEGRAGGKLLDEVKEIAKKTNVQPLEPAIGTPERKPQYVSVSVNIKTKSGYAGLRDFLFEMQAPERFVVFESVKLEVDKEDKTQVHGEFRIAQWFAPK